MGRRLPILLILLFSTSLSLYFSFLGFSAGLKEPHGTHLQNVPPLGFTRIGLGLLKYKNENVILHLLSVYVMFSHWLLILC